MKAVSKIYLQNMLKKGLWLHFIAFNLHCLESYSRAAVTHKLSCTSHTVSPFIHPSSPPLTCRSARSPERWWAPWRWTHTHHWYWTNEPGSEGPLCGWPGCLWSAPSWWSQSNINTAQLRSKRVKWYLIHGFTKQCTVNTALTKHLQF